MNRRPREDVITVRLTPAQLRAILQVVESVDAGAVADTGFARYVATATGGCRRLAEALAIYNGLRVQRTETRDRLIVAAGLSQRIDDQLARRQP